MKENVMFLLRNPLRVLVYLITRLPSFGFIRDTRDYQNRVSFNFWFNQKILKTGNNDLAYWPVHPTSTVHDADRILVGVDAYPGIMKGCYIHGAGGLCIGDYTQIAPGVAIVTANHHLYDSRRELAAPVRIGKYCWLGAGCKIMPGVELGDWTVVGAGAVVTKSFPDGHCVIGGVPAKRIKDLDRSLCIPFHNKIAYNGYIRSDKFPEYRRKHLKI